MKKTSRVKSPFYIIFTLVIVFLCAALMFMPVLKAVYPVKYMDEIKKYSDEYSLDEYLVMAIISTESKFNENAVSGKDAIGLMQLKNDTALWCMEKYEIKSDGRDIYSPSLNIETGCAYMRYLLDKFSQNTNTALAAYNAGEGNVAKWLGEQNQSESLVSVPFAETEKYVETVNKRMKIYKFLY